MSKNMVEPERPQMAIWWCVACWFNKATHAQAHARAYAPTRARMYALTDVQAYREICNSYCFSMATVVS
jgi:hypothetical protein